MSGYRSHTQSEIENASAKAWILDTGTFGEDDVLLGEYDEVLGDVLSYHELEALPETWTLTLQD